MKILRYELRKVISEGQEVISVPWQSRPLDCLWESEGSIDCPVLYWGNEGGGKPTPVMVKAISERENRDAPYEIPDGFLYFGLVHSQEGELFFIFSSLRTSLDNPRLS